MGKNKTRNSSKKRQIAVQESAEVNLGRFAGSSGEEDNVDDDDEEEEVPMKDVEEEVEEEMADENDVVAEEEVEEEEEEVDDDDEEVRAAASGMASAMARILGTQPKKASNASVILSKTTTPLQRMAAEEKEKLKVAREKRRSNRERNLTALHIPLSVATSRMTTEDAGLGLVKELELERSHRRVATRGVVALFNAIAQHQQQNKPDAVQTSKSDSNTETKHMTKHGFLDMIKSAAKDDSSKKQKGKDSAAAAASSKPQWNALKDDYMMGSKLKDWDKESSEDDDDDDEPVDDTFGDEEEAPAPAAPTTESGKKRRKVSSQ